MSRSALGRFATKVRVAAMTVAFRERVVAHAYGHSRRRVLLRDFTARSWYDRDWPAFPPEIADAAVGSERPLLFDIGAHQCVVAMMLADEIGADGSVVAVEPSFHNVSVAGANLELNRVTNVELVHAAVGAEDGRLRFPDAMSLDIRARRFPLRRREVPMVTVDTLSTRLGAPTCMFVDVDGAEGEVLRGAGRTLESEACRSWIVEVHVGCGLELFGTNALEIVDHFERHGFDLFIADAEYRTTFRPYGPEDPVLAGRFALMAKRPRS